MAAALISDARNDARVGDLSEQTGTPAPGRRSRLGLFALATILVLALGAVEGWFGRTDSGDVYGSDGVQYLDVARAFARGDWNSALNPLWSQGYPGLLAVVRPIFQPGPAGDWAATRWLNFGVFCFSWACFAWLVQMLTRRREHASTIWVGAVCVFVTTQVCLDQVSRVGPDQLLAAFFFLVCGLAQLLVKAPRSVVKKHRFVVGIALGVALGVGFLVKAAFLPLGCVVLLVTAFGTRRWREVALAAGLFAAITLAYGVQLSRVVGRPTLGESGALNYAWHVNRLAKWVHWEGGNDTADKAWPKRWIARFAQWDSAPPDFGTPLHPSQMVGNAPPIIYEFHAPVKATYVPYFDPPYWYEGYKHVTRWRYQVVALGKNVGDLAQVLARIPLFWAVGILWWKYRKSWWREFWPLLAISAIGVGIYLPVHLEGRYLAAFFAVICMVFVVNLTTFAPRQRKLAMAVLLVGFGAGLVKDQRGIWTRAVHGWSPKQNVEWRAAEGVRAIGLPAGSEVGVISWTANLHCDWAYMAGLQITSEITTPADESAFWGLSDTARDVVLQRFREAGARAVFTWDKPRDGAAGWEQLSGAPMWFHRL